MQAWVPPQPGPPPFLPSPPPALPHGHSSSLRSGGRGGQGSGLGLATDTVLGDAGVLLWAAASPCTEAWAGALGFPPPPALEPEGWAPGHGVTSG